MPGQCNRLVPILCGRFPNMLPIKTHEYNRKAITAMLTYRIQKWADENGFISSQTKTARMHVCNLRKLHQEPTLTLNGVAIPVVQEHKYLG